MYDKHVLTVMLRDVIKQHKAQTHSCLLSGPNGSKEEEVAAVQEKLKAVQRLLDQLQQGGLTADIDKGRCLTLNFLIISNSSMKSVSWLLQILSEDN